MIDQLWERKVNMIKENKNEVNEVEVVLAVLKEYLNEEKDMPYEVIKHVVEKLNKIKEEYNKTINDLLSCYSLVVKMERLYEIIGTISTVSIEDEDNLDKTLEILSNYEKSLNN